MIVSDASPLIVLLKTHKLSILRELFDEIIVPSAVYEEITVKEREKLIFNKIEWIKTRNVKNTEISTS